MVLLIIIKYIKLGFETKCDGEVRELCGDRFEKLWSKEMMSSLAYSHTMIQNPKSKNKGFGPHHQYHYHCHYSFGPNLAFCHLCSGTFPVIFPAITA